MGCLSGYLLAPKLTSSSLASMIVVEEAKSFKKGKTTAFDVIEDCERESSSGFEWRVVLWCWVIYSSVVLKGKEVAGPTGGE